MGYRMKLKDVVLFDERMGNVDSHCGTESYNGLGYHVSFPMTGTCAVCHGIKRGWFNGIELNKELAYQVALLHHGYNMAKWEGTRTMNIKYIPYKCKCKCDHDWNEVTIGRCLHKWTCTKCGVQITVDSSD